MRPWPVCSDASHKAQKCVQLRLERTGGCHGLSLLVAVCLLLGRLSRAVALLGGAQALAHGAAAHLLPHAPRDRGLPLRRRDAHDRARAAVTVVTLRALAVATLLAELTVSGHRAQRQRLQQRRRAANPRAIILRLSQSDAHGRLRDGREDEMHSALGAAACTARETARGDGDTLRVSAAVLFCIRARVRVRRRYRRQERQPRRHERALVCDCVIAPLELVLVLPGPAARGELRVEVVPARRVRVQRGHVLRIEAKAAREEGAQALDVTCEKLSRLRVVS
mmetsp:Transcript_8786/g.27629  ORF Transcript_8786/g.27629 Transcript_8786/m.27629 type:complete len:280 (-) Transcript_8786:46-885(-)